MAVAFVQAIATSNDANGTTLTTGTFTSTSGNAILVAVIYDHSTGGQGPLTTVTDSKLNGYTLIGGAEFTDANNNSCRHAYAPGITGGASHTVSANFSGTGASFRRMVVYEISGADTTSPLDQDSGGSSETGTAPTDTTVTTTTNGQFIFAHTMNAGGTGSDTFGAGATFIEPAGSTAAAASNELMVEYQIQTNAGNVTAAFTRTNSGLCNMRTSTFKEQSTAVLLGAMVM